jgi:hypothetical protein
MSCTQRFLNLQWQHHHLRWRVTGAEIVTAEEPDMWARPVIRDYVRCDKQRVCTACGTVRREVSCLCEPAKAEHCAIYQEWRSAQHAV